MGLKDPLQETEEIKIDFTEIEKQCKNWHEKGYKVMVVYQPITGSSVMKDFYCSMLSMLSGEIWLYMLEKHKIVVKPYVSPHFPIDANRNLAVRDVMERYKADYMMFVDTDQTFPAKTIPTLYEALLEKQKEQFLCVMAGMYFTKKNPWRGVFGHYGAWDEKLESYRDHFVKHDLINPKDGGQLLWWMPVDFWDKGSIFQVDVIGAGCMMMPTEVFELLEKPYFKYLPTCGDTEKMASEDMWFCAQLKKNNIPIWMNSNISCGHLSHYDVNEALYVNQRDTLIEHMPKHEAREMYDKMNDRRSPEEIAKYKNTVFKEDLGDE